MTIYVKREHVIANERAAAEAQLAAAASQQALQPLSGVWTPADSELLALLQTPEAGTASVEAAGLLPVLPITAEEYGPPLMESAATGADDLGLVLVRRQLDPLTHSEFRAIALQAIMCAYEYEDMRWLRSYWSRGTDQLFCLFETRSHELVREHARRSRIPCDEVLDAVEVRPA